MKIEIFNSRRSQFIALTVLAITIIGILVAGFTMAVEGLIAVEKHAAETQRLLHYIEEWDSVA